MLGGNKNTVMKLNYFREKVKMLEEFYMGIDQGYSYEVAVGQYYYYQTEKKCDIIKLVECIVISSRFLRNGKKVPQILEEKFIELDKKIDYETIEMMAEERISFESDYKEMKKHIDGGKDAKYF